MSTNSSRINQYLDLVPLLKYIGNIQIINSITTMSTRINIILSEKTISIIDSIAGRENRSNFISKAILYYVRNTNMKTLREQLIKGYKANAKESLKVLEHYS